MISNTVPPITEPHDAALSSACNCTIETIVEFGFVLPNEFYGIYSYYIDRSFMAQEKEPPFARLTYQK